jgi:enediyne biosynthesis protein E4
MRKFQFHFSGPRIGWMLGGLAVASLTLAILLARSPGPVRITLHDVTPQTEIAFQHTDGGCGRYYIMETVSAGLALLDYDGDGLIDIYFLNGAPLPGCTAETTPRNALYRNLGECRFADVTEQAGVGDPGYALGVVAGDYDNDGDLDLFVNNYGPDVLYRNRGDGTFENVAAPAGVRGGGSVGAGAAFLDADGDGDLDLFVANYLEFSEDQHLAPTTRGVPVYVSPNHFPPGRNQLYRNNGDGSFTDISQAAGIGRDANWAMGMVCADYDNDGDTDVFVANDVADNFLYQNDGRGNFQEVALAAGVAYDMYGSPQGSMGVECGDYDNDGWLDFYQTSYQLQHAVLYRNLGGKTFEDVSFATGAGAGTFPHVTWGSGLVDFDNDGDRDLYVACGHLQVRVDEYDTSTTYRPRNLLLLNTGDGKFVDVSDQAGDGMQAAFSSRGAAFDDLDGDGLVDVVVLNSRALPTVLRNATRARNRWIEIVLRGVTANRDGVGTRVTVTAGSTVQTAEVHAGRSYQSHFGTRLHFGLGNQARADRVEVRWLGGGRQTIENVAAGQRLVVIEAMR